MGGFRNEGFALAFKNLRQPCKGLVVPFLGRKKKSRGQNIKSQNLVLRPHVGKKTRGAGCPRGLKKTRGVPNQRKKGGKGWVRLRILRGD